MLVGASRSYRGGGSLHIGEYWGQDGDWEGLTPVPVQKNGGCLKSLGEGQSAMRANRIIGLWDQSK